MPRDREAGGAPLLTGATAQRAVDAIMEVARALRTPEQVAEAAGDTQAAADLPAGCAGTALLYAYLHRAERAGHEELAAARIGERDHVEVAMRHLDAAIEAMATRPMGAGLLGGFPGIAWAVTHVEAMLGGADEAGDADETGDVDAANEAGDADEASGEDDGAAGIDEVLRDLAGTTPWTGEYDLVSGLVGLGVYALERLPRPAAQQCLAAVLDRLDELAERDAGGVTWFTPPALLPEHQRARCPDGYYNLGLAHGVPGVIALLGRAWAAGVDRERVGALLHGALAWLRARALPETGGARFAWAHAPGETPAPTRSAWCYGDPGVAAALLVAGLATGNARLVDEAHALALLAARRPRDQAGVADVGLCHGSAGLAQIFTRAYQATGDPVLAEVARSWLTWTLDARDPGAAPSLAGFRARHADASGAMGWSADPGLLVGATGVALTLLAAVTGVAPDWDRALLLSHRRS